MHCKILVKIYYLNFNSSSYQNMFVIKCICEAVTCSVLFAKTDRLRKNISFIFHYLRRKRLPLFKPKIH